MPGEVNSPIVRVVRAANAARRRTLRRSGGGAFQSGVRRRVRREARAVEEDGEVRGTTFHAHAKTSSRSARREDLREVLLWFPEHDASTVAALLHNFGGDKGRVVERLSQVRALAGGKDGTEGNVAVGSEISSGGGGSEGVPGGEVRPVVGSKRRRAGALFGEITDLLRERRGEKGVGEEEEEEEEGDDTEERRLDGDVQSSEISGESNGSEVSDRGTANGKQEQVDNVRMLHGKMEQLEEALRKLEKSSGAQRREARRRMELGELEINALELRHEALLHELDENQRRVVKTEQYLDSMRRDVLQAIRARESTVSVVIRSGLHNLLYYLLAYLVPVLAFFIRVIRDSIVHLRIRFRPAKQHV